jgi:hypothetical protein
MKDSGSGSSDNVNESTKLSEKKLEHRAELEASLHEIIRQLEEHDDNKKKDNNNDDEKTV